MDYFRNVVALPSLAATGAKLSFKGFVTGELWIALVTFLYIDFLDTTGTLFSMASFINNYIPGAPCLASALCHHKQNCMPVVQASPKDTPGTVRVTLLALAGFVGANKEFPRQTFAFSVDGIASIIGSLMGTSPVRAHRAGLHVMHRGRMRYPTLCCVLCAQRRPARHAWASRVHAVTCSVAGRCAAWSTCVTHPGACWVGLSRQQRDAACCACRWPRSLRAQPGFARAGALG